MVIFYYRLCALQDIFSKIFLSDSTGGLSVEGSLHIEIDFKINSNDFWYYLHPYLEFKQKREILRINKNAFQSFTCKLPSWEIFISVCYVTEKTHPIFHHTEVSTQDAITWVAEIFVDSNLKFV